MRGRQRRFRILLLGNILLWVFLLTTIIATWHFVPLVIHAFETQDPSGWPSLLLAVAGEFVLFWIGIIIVYMTSTQLGIRTRVLGVVFGMIPVAHIVMLLVILRTTGKEAVTELRKCKLDEAREGARICQTRYPLLMVHGVFFRDYEHLNYWGRIPGELIQNGATVYYGEHHSAASVRDCATELCQRIEDIVRETGCEKLNVIAHSKGGLDMRAAIALTPAASHVASLTTINTPHRGCEYADYLLGKIPESQQQVIARTYEAAASRLGDTDPDFMAAVTDLTASACASLNETIADDPNVLYQSIGSVMSRPTSGRFPLNMTHSIVGLFDGRNDGLVGEQSFPWGSSFRLLTPTGRRGISHGDVIDLNRENIDGFDVREFYVQLVADLKQRGY